MRESLDFILGDSAVVELLGRQNFSNVESAVLELVKNSFDAGADNCNIHLENNMLTFVDDGKGMSEEVIRQNWMVVGKSDKKYKIDDRVLSGSKGVGRFAIARLGDKVLLSTKAEGQLAVDWETDWNDNTISTGSKKDQGTEITIKNLRDKWTKSQIKKVITFLNHTYNDDVMKISFTYQGDTIPIVPLYREPKLGENFVSRILLTYNSTDMELKIDISSDEFLESVANTIGRDTKNFSQKISILKFFDKDIAAETISEDFLKNIGDFSAELYFSLSVIQVDDCKTFQYKYRKLPERYNNGVALYRNSFSISSLEGKKDWLELNARARRSPAAATHQTGAWRVRSNQLSGKVNIDKKKNKYLMDIANRQGLEENDYYNYFIQIIHQGLSNFERFRQKIIRDYATKTGYYDKVEIPNDDTLKKIVDNPVIVKNFNNDDAIQLAQSIKNVQEKMIKQEQYAESIRQNYYYDTRILNLLATQGLRGMSVAHDLHTNRNSLADRPIIIEEIIKKKELWDILDNKKKSHLSVPYQLRHLRSEIQPLITFLDVMLSQNTKKNFILKIESLDIYFEELVKRWENERKNIVFTIQNLGMNDLFMTKKDVMDVIFDNLILNSYQQNILKNNLEISIIYEIIDNKIFFTYSDNGKGLDSKYLENPFQILEVHESNRNDGHGLGMWLLNRTIQSERGQISNITSKSGFQILFNFEGENDAE